MRANLPHVVLFSDVAGRANRWRFVLQSAAGQPYLAAEDTEPGHHPNRLELLAVVRGLEALDGPARVTLVTKSRYVRRGLRRCLGQWRARRWRWERFGQLVPIRDHDLWQRVDRALQFHRVDCRPWRDETSIASQPLPVGHRRLADAAPIAPEQRAACGASSAVDEPALVIVPRPQRTPSTECRPWLRALERLRHNVLTPLATLCRPAFTRAA